jgi:hypothetical protein
MYRRVFALCVALLLLCSVPAALADTEKYRMVEDFVEFDVEVAIPAEALYKQNPKDGWLNLEIWYDAPSKPLFTVNIDFSDVTESKFLGDFSPDEIDHFLYIAGEDFSVPDFEFFVTPSGNTVLFTRETDLEAGDYATMMTVYKGFVFSLYCRHKDYAPLTEEDIRLMHLIVEETWIIDTDKY